MNISSAMSYLEKHTSRSATTDDYGVYIMMKYLHCKFVQHKNTNLYTLIKNTYSGNDLRQFLERSYMINVYETSSVQPNLLLKAKSYINKSTVDDKYEFTHYILAHILQCEKYHMSLNCNQCKNMLKSFIEKNKYSDIKTEAVFLLMYIDPFYTNWEYMNMLKRNQDCNGHLHTDLKHLVTHHTVLGVACMKYNVNNSKNKSLLLLFIICIVLLTLNFNKNNLRV